MLHFKANRWCYRSINYFCCLWICYKCTVTELLDLTCFGQNKNWIFPIFFQFSWFPIFLIYEFRFLLSERLLTETPRITGRRQFWYYLHKRLLYFNIAFEEKTSSTGIWTFVFPTVMLEEYLLLEEDITSAKVWRKQCNSEDDTFLF